MAMNIVLWIIFGALAGWVASMIVKTDAQQGGFANIVIGILGAFAGGFIMRTLGGAGVTGFNLSSLLVAIVGSVVLLMLYRVVARR